MNGKITDFTGVAEEFIRDSIREKQIRFWSLSLEVMPEGTSKRQPVKN